MSQTTAAKLVYRVKTMLDDPSFTDPKKASLPKILSCLDRAFLWVRSDLPAKLDYTATFLTLAVGTAIYNITETDPIALTGFRLNSDGYLLRKVPLDTLQTYRIGNPVMMGFPLLIAFEEAESGSVQAHVWPTPAFVDTITATTESGPSVTFEGQAAADLTSVTLAIGQYGAEAVCYFAATLCGGDFLPLAEEMRGKESERIMDSQLNPGIELVDA